MAQKNRSKLPKSSVGGPPERLLDYFVVTGLVDSSPLQDEYESLKSLQAKAEFRPSMIDRYPEEDRLDTPFPKWICEFCLPRGLSVTTNPPNPSFSSFISNSHDGKRLFGACLIIHELLHGITIKNTSSKHASPEAEMKHTNEDGDQPQGDKVYISKCLTFISHHPFYRTLEVFLRWIYICSRYDDTPSVEQCIVHFMRDIPVPAPSGQQILYKLNPKITVPITRRSPYHPPLVELPTRHLLKSLSVAQLITVISALLTDKRVLILCSDEAQLTPATETLLSLIHPLHWAHLYLPLFPKSRIEELQQYIHPFLAGANYKTIQHIELPKNCIVVDLERQLVDTSRLNSPLPKLPKRVENPLLTWLPNAPELFPNTYLQKDISLQILSLIAEKDSEESSSQFMKEFESSVAVKQLLRMYKQKSHGADPSKIVKFFEQRTKKGVFDTTNTQTPVPLSDMEVATDLYDDTFSRLNIPNMKKYESGRNGISRQTVLGLIRYGYGYPYQISATPEARRFLVIDSPLKVNGDQHNGSSSNIISKHLVETVQDRIKRIENKGSEDFEVGTIRLETHGPTLDIPRAGLDTPLASQRRISINMLPNSPVIMSDPRSPLNFRKDSLEVEFGSQFANPTSPMNPATATTPMTPRNRTISIASSDSEPPVLERMPPKDELASFADDESDSDFDSFEIEAGNMSFMKAINENAAADSAATKFPELSTADIEKVMEGDDDPFAEIEDFAEPEPDQTDAKMVKRHHHTRTPQRSQQFLGEFQLSESHRNFFHKCAENHSKLYANIQPSPILPPENDLITPEIHLAWILHRSKARI